MIVLQVYGLGTLFMKFNVFVTAALLMCMGLAIEFTAHVAAAFSHAEGALAQRIGKAMAETFPAIFEGSVSTLLSILPMAFSATFGGTIFEVKYFFGSFALVV